MGQIPWAAYDPLFWAHHAMIDRIWRLWQLRHGAVGPPQSMWNVALPPFPMTVGQTLEHGHARLRLRVGQQPGGGTA